MESHRPRAVRLTRIATVATSSAIKGPALTTPF